MNVKKNKKPKSFKPLMIEDNGIIKNVNPGDIYYLNVNIDLDTDQLTCKTDITIRYIWDGKVLKRYYGS